MVAGTLLGETGAERDGVGALAARVTGRCLGILRAVNRPTAEMEKALAGAAPGTLRDRIASAIIPGAAARPALPQDMDVEPRLSELSRRLGGLDTPMYG